VGTARAPCPDCKYARWAVPPLSGPGVATGDRSRYCDDHFAGASSEGDRVPVRALRSPQLFGLIHFPPSHGDTGRPVVQKIVFFDDR